MSDTDSFIDEVSEEVRRDRQYKIMRKWGWIPISLVILLVGGAAYNEWSKARNQQAAQLLGSDILQAIQIEQADERSTAYATIATQGDNIALLALLEAGDAEEESDAEHAVTLLGDVVSDESLPEIYRHLAELKLLLIQGDTMLPEDRMIRLQAIAGPGAPYRLLAEEQMAIAEMEIGGTDAALVRLQAILADGQLTPGLRRRVSQLIIALGGELDQT
ncbi:MAG: tetratricopeptide repeat protein [Paracoccaceae bacterium]